MAKTERSAARRREGKRSRSTLSRRRFLGLAVGGALAASFPAPGCARKARPAASAKKTLRILQWSHFVPRYDVWFDRVFTKEWGDRHSTEVIVDHMTATEIAARAAAEAAAGKGHDLFLFQSPPAAYENKVLDHREVAEEAQRRHGKMVPLAYRSSFNPKTQKYFAFSDSYVADPGNYRIDLWGEAGYPAGPDSWEDLRVGGSRIRRKHGIPVGLGLSQETDSNMALRALLWSFGGSDQTDRGEVAIASRETLEALRYARALYREAMTPEVFTWDPSSNNRMILSGRGSFVQNAISVTRTAERENPAMAAKIGLVAPLRGPVRRMASEHLMNCYVIWNFAENPEGAKEFLVDLVDASATAFRESEFYNLPCFPSTVPDAARLMEQDERGEPRGKYLILASALDWSANVGFPGFATAAVDEVFNTFIIPTMFARAARGEATPEEAMGTAERQIRRIFERWSPPG
jgi:multiple sugar transport system substrate-binding protein